MQSIQRVLSSIRIEQVCLYLHRAGWSKSVSGGRVDFEKIDDRAGETFRVFLPSNSSHPRFRNLLPNLVFAVSITEEREPIDVANDMAGLNVALAPAGDDPRQADPRHDGPGQTGQPTVRLTLRNSSPHIVDLQAADESSAYPMQPDEELLLVAAQANPACVLEITSAASLRVGRGSIFLGLPQRHAQGTSLSQRGWLAGSIAEHTLAASDEHPGPANRLDMLFHQFNFAIESLENLASQPAPLLRASAVLLCGVSQLMPDIPISQTELFQLARRLLSAGQLTFPLREHQAAALWHISRNDEQIAPVKTLAWLTTEAFPAGQPTRA